MTKLLYCVESEAFFMDPKPNLPTHLILDLEDALTIFRARLSQLENFDVDLKMVLGDIIEDIMHEGDAFHNVCVTNHEYLSEAADGPFALDVSNYINARQALATALINELQGFKAYIRGVFCYQISQILPRSLVLEKITVEVTDPAELSAQDRQFVNHRILVVEEEENKRREQRSVARALDFAVRRFGAGTAASAAKSSSLAGADFDALSGRTQGDGGRVIRFGRSILDHFPQRRAGGDVRGL